MSTADDTATLNCSSTQCSSLAVGQRVALSCYSEWNVFQPSEEECRFSRLVTK